MCVTGWYQHAFCGRVRPGECDPTGALDSLSLCAHHTSGLSENAWTLLCVRSVHLCVHWSLMMYSMHASADIYMYSVARYDWNEWRALPWLHGLGKHIHRKAQILPHWSGGLEPLLFNPTFKGIAKHPTSYLTVYLNSFNKESWSLLKLLAQWFWSGRGTFFYA